MKKTNYIGVDIGKDKLYIALINVNKANAWIEFVINNTTESILEWLAEHEALAKESHFIFESTGTYSYRFMLALSNNEITYSIVNPAQSAGFAKVQQSISKTDKRDARMLVSFGLAMNPKPHVLEDENSHQAKQLLTLLKYYKDIRSKIQNKLHALSYDPRASQVVVEDLKEELERIEEKIADLSKQLEELTKADFAQEKKLARSIVGVGPVTADAVLAFSGGIGRFPNSKAFAKFLGLAVVESSSGTKTKPGKINRSSVDYCRSILYMASRSAKKYNNACKALYERLRKENKPHKLAMIAVARKLVHQIFTIVSKGVPFDNSLYLKTNPTK